MKNGVRLGISLLLSGIFLFWALSGIDATALWATMRAISPLWAATYVGALAMTQLTRAVRWHLLVQPFCSLSFKAIWGISNVGNLLIMLLPLRLGEFVRPYLMKKQGGVALSAGMGAAVVERVLDGLLVTLMFFVSTYSLDAAYVVPRALQVGAITALLLFVGLLAGIILTLWAHSAVPHILWTLGGRYAPAAVRRVITLLDAFVHGLRALPNVGRALQVVAWTLAYWGVNALGMYGLMRAFGWALPLAAGFTAVCVLVIGIMIPAGPGFLGIYQAAIMAGLSVYGVPRADAAAYSLVAWVLNVAVLCAFGLPYFIGRDHLHLGEMVHAPQEPSL